MHAPKPVIQECNSAFSKRITMNIKTYKISIVLRIGDGVIQSSKCIT